MELKDRLQLILTEQHIKQKDLAKTIKVTESYISNMLNGKRSNLSEALALLIEIAEIEKMSEPELDAVKVFIDSLDGYKRAFQVSEKD